MTRVAAVVVLLSAIALDASQATSVAGRVLTADGSTAIANARVRIATAGHPATLLVTDADGRFPIDVSSGALTITVTKSGYVRREATLNAGAPAIELRLERAAVIAGRVLGAGEPIVDARVVVNRVQADPNARSAPVATVTTDDGANIASLRCHRAHTASPS
ncbi:MAG TPA: carboxypeptidase-like regulatory domain-containing protein [Vicinamibacterales bacterium]|nr:carboxypeptidase-like regulatory domain-containing protein [Vicinamibacterales bacterium]